MDIERRIDDVARRMTAAGPSEHLRERVLERLGARRVGTAWRRRTIVLAASLALLTGGAARWLTRVTSFDVAVRVPRTTASPRQLDIAVAEARSTLVGTARRPGQDRPRGTDASPDERPSNAGVAALSPSTTIVLTDIQPTRLEIPLLEMTPIATEPLTVAPLASTLGG